MTRKRYIKLLMAIGLSRNEASSDARETCGCKLPYAASWAFTKALTTPPDFSDAEVLPDGTLRWIVPVTTALPSSLAKEIQETLRRVSPLQLSQELPDPGLWPKVNPHRHDGIMAWPRYEQLPRTITEVSLVKSGGYPLGGGQA